MITFFLSEEWKRVLHLARVNIVAASFGSGSVDRVGSLTTILELGSGQGVLVDPGHPCVVGDGERAGVSIACEQGNVHLTVDAVALRKLAWAFFGHVRETGGVGGFTAAKAYAALLEPSVSSQQLDELAREVFAEVGIEPGFAGGVAFGWREAVMHRAAKKGGAA